MKKQAVIVVDMINDFVTGALGCERGRAVVPAIVQLVEGARKKGLPVIYCCDAHHPGVDGELKLWGEHAIAGSEGAQVIPELAPRAGDYVIPKRRYSGFFGTDLDVLLRELGVDSVIICGLLINLCIQHTACDAYCLGYEVIVPEDTTDALDEATNLASREYIKMAYGAKMPSLAEILDEMK